MRILVTGATSMIGSEVVRQLIARGDEVTTFQRRPSQLPVAEVLGDLTEPSEVGAATREQDAVIHLAAKVGVTGSLSAFDQVNVGGTLSLAASARRSGVRRFVHVSSPSVAHSGQPLVAAPAGPADPEHTRGHYATTKAEAERALLRQSSDDMRIVALRPHLVWGPGDEQLVGRIVERAQQGRLAFVGSGLALIDSTYVENAASAMVAAVDRLGEDAGENVAGRALVVSNGQPRTVVELVERILQSCGVHSGVGQNRATRRHVPFRLAFGVGAVAERIWERRGRSDDPPMTSFLAEQLATAHWFDQLETQRLLQWRPTVDLDTGFERLAASRS